MSRFARIALLTTVATAALAPTALAGPLDPTAVLETSAKPILSTSFVHAPMGTKVFFSGYHSKPNVYGGAVKKLEWDLNGNGVYETVATDPLPSVSWTYQGAGRWVHVGLRVTNTVDHTDTESVWVRLNEAPKPAFVADPTQPIAGQSFDLDASATTDDEGGLTYKWDVDGNGVNEFTTMLPTVPWTFAVAGSRTVKLTVADRLGQEATLAQNVSVNTPPVVATPTPSPTPTPVADTAAPVVSITPTRPKLRGSKITMTVTCPAGESHCGGILKFVRQGKSKFVSAPFDLAGGASQPVVITANKKARKRVKRIGSLTTLATAKATDSAGNTGTATAAITVLK